MKFHRALRSSLIAGIVTLLAGASSDAGESSSWTYTGETGPAHWAKLSPEYAACGIGVNQSPVDIRQPIAAALEPLAFEYQTGSTDIINNGHTLQINAAPGNWLLDRGHRFQLQQLHFHSPSEHRINGEFFPLEAHLVHQDADGNIAVVAVLFREGNSSEEIAMFGELAPRTTGTTASVEIEFSELHLHRKYEKYYRYSGSLTTPPCTEGIRWFILKEAQQVSADQVADFIGLIGEDARGPQPLNARVVLEN